MAALTWQRWADPIVDFGRELYVAQQLAHGQVLFRDVFYFHGPLSPHFNALLFRLFGESIATLTAANLAIAAAILALLYRLLLKISGAFAATVASLIFCLVFAFGRLVKTGNFNFVTPYAHEMTHGMFLCLLGLTALAVYLRSGKRVWAAGAGLAAGLAFLTKAEFGLAGVASIGTGLGLSFAAGVPRHPARGRRVAALFAALAAAVIPPAAAFGLLLLRLTPQQALAGTLGSWHWIFSRQAADAAFYRFSMGAADPLGSLWIMARWSGIYLALFESAALVDRFGARFGRGRLWLSAGLLAAVAALLFRGGPEAIRWEEIFRPLPLATLGLAAVLTAKGLRSGFTERRILQITFAVFALALLAKIALYTRVHNVGFSLAMPAALLSAVALIDWIPRALRRMGGQGYVFRSFALMLLGTVTALHVLFTVAFTGRQGHPVGTGRNRLLADERGAALEAMRLEIDRRAAADQTLLVMPYGALLNFLTGHANPTPYWEVTPFLRQLAGGRFMAELEENPPDFIVRHTFDLWEYGPVYSGAGIEHDLAEWIGRNYAEVRRVGDHPDAPAGFGMLLLQRRPEP